MIAALAWALWPARLACAENGPFIAGADISMLPAIEKAGGVYRRAGQAGDAVQILHDAGCNLFRVRLFVDPTTDFLKGSGAVQSLPYVIALAKRIKKVDALFLLDIHYSDTWADPLHQLTPAAWKDLDSNALQQKVYTYTKSVLQQCQDNGVMPDMVQVGNEITAGMLWPTGQLYAAKGNAEERQWQNFSALFNAGAKAVREAQSGDHKIRIVLHIHGGGRDGLPKWFFDKISHYSLDYDIMGLSFYPAWHDSLPLLRKNMADLVQTYNKDILIAEVSYPWSPLPDVHDTAMTWPQTPQGQAQFLRELTAALRAVPHGHGLGYVWWYPEAVPVSGTRIWRDGDEALFDDKGDLLPAADLFKQMTAPLPQ
jgi:arabinogalactan endo-1,4-beta-galactosidase